LPSGVPSGPTDKANEADLVGLEAFVRLLSDQGLDPDEAEGDQFEGEIRKEKLARLRSERRQGEYYAFLSAVIPVGWVATVLTIVMLDGFGVCGFSLSDGVLIALVGSLAAAVFRPFDAITGYLFSRGGRSD